MTHSAEIKEIKQLSDGAISACIRCCGDPQTDSWHTIYLSATSTQADIEAWESERILHVQNQHASLQVGLQYLQSKVK